jgi:zinc and cadmium transporter
VNHPASLTWIAASGLTMALVGLVGAVTLLLEERTFRRLLLPLVAFSAGSLLGGAFLHLLPSATEHEGFTLGVSLAVLSGFAVFFLLEQFLHWHHCHRVTGGCDEPVTYLILIASALHKLIGGVAVAGSLLVDLRLGLTIWLATAVHEVPHELGDFAVLVHAGWARTRALFWRVISAFAFPLGCLAAYFVASQSDVRFLVPFAAGNFLYIGASDLVPEVNHHQSWRSNLLHLACFLAGILTLLALRLVGHEGLAH